VIWLDHADGRVSIEEQQDGRRRVTVHAKPGIFVSRPACITSYPVDLIARIGQVKSLAYLADNTAREEDPNHVVRYLRYSLLGYVPEEAFQGCRLLDFGSGSGASTVVLARVFRRAAIVGVEVDADLLQIATMRAEHFRLSNMAFVESPGPETLPDDLGEFDFINLGAVYEHLVPHERPLIPAQLWSLLKLRGDRLWPSESVRGTG
jgi:SAM-dependent methyltransferase